MMIRQKKIIHFLAFITCLFWAGLSFADIEENVEKEFKKGCRKCHNELIEKWDASAVRHFPYRREKCETCHALEHKQFNSELNKSCTICHDLASEKIKEGHAGADVTGKNCFFCHYTHASADKGLLKETQHVPFSSGMCSVCHEKNELKPKENLQDVCLSCHTDKKVKEGELVHTAFEMVDCTNCHNPHTTAAPKLLLGEITEMCLQCHDKDMAQKHPIDIVASEKIKLAEGKEWLTYENKVTCVSCHDPHKSKNHLLLRETMDDGQLCDNCHVQP